MEPSSIEPLPHINYFLLNRLVALARPHLTRHQLKRLDYVVDARRSFYESHAKHGAAYRDLLDADACAETLDQKFKELTSRLADAVSIDSNNVPSIRKDISDVEKQQMNNNEDMRVRLLNLEEKTKTRQHVAAWFSELKVVFLRDEMPWLVALGKQCYQWAMAQQGM